MAATLDELRNEVLKDIERRQRSAFEVCPNCCTGLLNLYSTDLKALVCNLDCEPIPSQKTGSMFIDRRMKGLQIELEKYVDSTQVQEDKIASTLLGIEESLQAVESEIDQRMADYGGLLSKISDLLQRVNSKTDFEEVFCSELVTKREQFQSDRTFYEGLSKKVKENNQALASILKPLTAEIVPPEQKSQKPGEKPGNTNFNMARFQFNEKLFAEGVEAICKHLLVVQEIENCTYNEQYTGPTLFDEETRHSICLAEILTIFYKLLQAQYVVQAKKKPVKKGKKR